MSKAKRILWGEGMFLRPQHFQQQAMFADEQRAELTRLLRRNAWGMARCRLDEEALRGGQVRIDELEVLFRDGTLYQAPGDEPLPLSRNLNELPQTGVATTLYACLPYLQPYGNNTWSDSGAPPRPTRYRNQQVEVVDYFTQALESELTTLVLDVRLMIEEENRDGYDAIAIAKLVKDANGQWVSAADFLPPMTSIHATAELPRLLRRLLDILLVKSQNLAGGHRERAKNVLEFGTIDIASFWLLHTVNRNFAALSHLSRCEPLPPEELYCALATFCGELQTFSNLYTLADIPPYRHEALQEVFPVIDAQVRELLETVISARYMIIPLASPKPSFYVGRLESDRLLENVDYYLSVQSDLPTAQILENVPMKLKIGAPDDVEKILNSALRGVSLVHAPQTPSAIPVRVGNHYFSLEPRGDIYQRMLQSHSICIYVPQLLTDLKLELIAVFR